MAARAEQPVETIKMVENAMGVLDLLRTGKQPLGVNEIAKTCGLNPSTTFRILKTLETSGWIYKTNDDRYITGQKISFVTEKDNLYLALKEVSLYVMREYTAKYNHAMNLLVRDGSNCMILQQSRTNNLMDYTPPLHTTLPFYCCAGGKILLSELPTNLTKQIIDSCDWRPLTPRTITDPQKFWQVIQEAARQGYAFDHNESIYGASCVSVPVRNHLGTIIATLSFSGFMGVEDPATLLNFVPALQEASAEISRRLFSCFNGA